MGAVSEKTIKKFHINNLQFEKLLSMLSARFINVSAQNVDNEINDSLNQICSYLGFDLASLWQIDKGNPENLILTNYYRRFDGPEVQEKMNAKNTYPWALKEALRKKVLNYTVSSKLPPEASIDIKSNLYFGLLSNLVFPLYAGNSPVFGVLTFNTIHEEIEWSEEVVNKLQFIAQVFANALSRKNKDEILRENEERLRLAGSTAGAGFWDLIINTRKLWINDGTKKLYNFHPDENLCLEDFMMKIHPDDRERVESDIQNSLLTGTYLNEHRVLLPDGTLRWILGRATLHQDSEKNPERLLGISIDITRDKEVEKILRESEELKSSILDTIYSHLMVLDSNGIILSVNKAWQKFNKEFSNLKDVFNINAGENYLSALEKAINTGSKNLLKRLNGIKSVINGISSKYECEYTVNCPSGELWFLNYVIPLKHKNKGIVIVNRDITELKKSQLSLRHAMADVNKLREQLQRDSIYLKEEIKLQTKFGNILGHSDAIKYCLFGVEKVAPLNTTVLIYGETGTGKELIARAIHEASPRKERPLIKVDCSTLHPSIIESELFGHEKGAYTDAKLSSIGRFELADGSTLFLDEISELPLEVQSKLLRITQYGEFERLGSSKTRKTDIRLIAATNRDLEEEVKKGRFREDLFFRLNVFRITVPPLRERKNDIPEMVIEFIKKMNRKLGKNIEVVSQATLNRLMAYSWPGNVRELENIIEYSVITSRGNELEVNLETRSADEKEQEDLKIIPLAKFEKEYILKILEKTYWKIEGSNSASEILKLAPSTLRDRMKKLKIKRK